MSGMLTNVRRSAKVLLNVFLGGISQLMWPGEISVPLYVRVTGELLN